MSARYTPHRALDMVAAVSKNDEEQQDSAGVSPWLGTTEAARYLGVVPRTLYRMLDEGQIPAYKMGRVIRIKRTDLEAYLEEHRVEPGSLKHLYPDRIDGDRDDE